MKTAKAQYSRSLMVVWLSYLVVTMRIVSKCRLRYSRKSSRALVKPRRDDSMFDQWFYTLDGDEDDDYDAREEVKGNG